MRHKIIVDGNLEVYISSIEQNLTYSNLLEGFPNQSYNAEIIYREGKDKYFNEIYVIDPKQTQILYLSEDNYAIPKVTCRITVRSNKNLKDAGKDFSSLRIVWFQDDYVFPIDKEIIENLKEIPYHKLCGEYEN
ncbi:hypothetical protein MPF19_06310 [Polaribacter sp. Z014]|uniref:hypothetical protein n=1 Tax=Polaribacter sp. Z014 TaxID=2927126 RepID=UPI002020C7DD|nr:hypothetical protein [Polaribacter sp. Z014]MCL7763025.1 hypothetical protein [Polaribacter sp. Z014]